MKVNVLVLVGCLLLPISAIADDCEFSNFPDFWADAQDQVNRIKVVLTKAEKEHPYSMKTSKSFRQSLTVCDAKRKAVYDDPTGNGGTLLQSKCEAVLMCSRLSILSE